MFSSRHSHARQTLDTVFVFRMYAAKLHECLETLCYKDCKADSELRLDSLKPKFDILQHLGRRAPTLEQSQQLRRLMAKGGSNIVLLEQATHGPRQEEWVVARGISRFILLDQQGRIPHRGRLERKLDSNTEFTHWFSAGFNVYV